MSFTVGENIGPYRIVEQLGQGGMATVYKAYHASLDRYVALKALHPAFNEDKNFASRFQREARVVAKLEHPNIVPVYDYAEHEGRPYLVMKYIEGDTLKARLNQGPLSSEEINHIVNAVGSALAYAHKQGVLHRDIKPSNVLVATDGQMYLADFGLARIAQSGESTLSSDMIMGTPQYISPEQAMGKKDLDVRTDLYSFGVMLYEMVVGQVPFNADTPFSVIHDHIYTPLPLPHKVNPNVPEAVERVLLKALAKEREDRYEDVSILVQAFKDAWEEAGIPMQGTFIRLSQALKPAIEKTPPSEASTKLAAPAQAPATTVEPQDAPASSMTKVVATEAASSPKKKRSASAWLWVSAGLVILLCLGFIGYARNNRLFAKFLARSGNPPATQVAQPPQPQESAPEKNPLVKDVSASAFRMDGPPSAATDGNVETVWNSGKDPVQWIMIDYGIPGVVTEIRLLVSQSPGGDTIHQIWGGTNSKNLTLLREFKGITHDGDWLVYKPSGPVENIRFIRVVTTRSNSWVAWREIEVIIAQP